VKEFDSEVHGWWTVSYVMLWIVVVVLLILVVALARQIGTLHLRLGPRGALEVDDEGPPIGDAPEHAELEALSGGPVDIGGPGEAQLLLWVSPGCHVCEQVLPSVPVVAARGRLSPYVLTDVDVHETRRSYGARDLKAPIVPARFLARSYGVPGTPYVTVLDELGVVRAKGTVNNLEQMEGLVDSAEHRVRTARTERETRGA
jgi:methylamine dehydrogenase accessory protein MauD